MSKRSNPVEPPSEVWIKKMSPETEAMLENAFREMGRSSLNHRSQDLESASPALDSLECYVVPLLLTVSLLGAACCIGILLVRAALFLVVG